MRWVPWLLGIAGVVQHAIIAYVAPDGYVPADTSYLVMWLAIIGALVVCYLSCYGDCCGYDHGGDGPMGACDCCDGHCHCGDCDACDPASHGHGDGNGHAH